MDQSQKLQSIYRQIYSCTLCHSNTQGTVKPDPQKVPREFFQQILGSEIFMIAQSLAESQVRLSGIPFHNVEGDISRGGKFMEKYFNIVGYTIRPENKQEKLIYSTDIVQCFPGRKISGSGDNVPLLSEIKNCQPWLDRELAIMNPKVILLFGTPATKLFYQHYLNEPFLRLVNCYLNPKRFRKAWVFSLPHPTSMVKGKSSIYKKTFEMIKDVLLGHFNEK